MDPFVKKYEQKMEKNKERGQEVSLTDAYSLFVYAIWTFTKIIGFLQFQRERVQREEITAATLYNFVKALKLFCKMSDVPV